LASLPALRNTGPAVGLECVLLESRYPGCTVASLGSDHHIGKPGEFCRLLRVAEEAVEEDPDALFTLGVKPTRVETGYGYIQKGGVARQVNGEPVYGVARFREKPDEPTARRYVESGDFLWNSGIFVWRADAILENMQTHLKSTWRAFEEASRHLGTDQENAAIRQAYYKSTRISIDVGIMERASHVYVVPGSFGWSDIGDWRAVYDLSDKNRHGNVLRGNVIVHDTSRCLVNAGKRLVAVVGIHDVVVVDTDDALLICHQNSTQQVKNVVDYLHAHQHKDFV